MLGPESEKRLIVIVGPTAVGKTTMAIAVSQALNTVVLSADSRQFYREMSIGTAKPSPSERAAVPHYFIDTLSIHDDYSAGDYEQDALKVLEVLFAERDQVVLVGGSGLFVDAVCVGLDQLPKPQPGVRDRLNAWHKEAGLEALQERLREVDPIYYAEVDIDNSQRVIRALEVYESTGKPFSSFRQRDLAKRPFRTIFIGLNAERATVYERINRRVDQMMESGLLDEAKALYPFRNRPPLLTVGYTELFDYFDGKTSLETAVERIKQNTRRFAKRQLTWFRRREETAWFEPHATDNILAHIRKQLAQPGKTK